MAATGHGSDGEDAHNAVAAVNSATPMVTTRRQAQKVKQRPDLD
jgi:hypothetical protein